MLNVLSFLLLTVVNDRQTTDHAKYHFLTRLAYCLNRLTDIIIVLYFTEVFIGIFHIYCIRLQSVS